MKLFLHTLSRIRIMNGDQDFQTTPDAFQAFEAAYPGLPDGMVTRYQTPELAYVQDAAGHHHADPFDALPYCNNIGGYVATPPAVWIHCELAKPLLCASDPSDTIPYTLAIRTGPDPADPLVPIPGVWPITLRQKNGLAMDNILVAFTNGQASGVYTYYPGLPLGEWYIDAADFTTVPIDGVEHIVKLAQDVRFTVYRS